MRSWNAFNDWNPRSEVHRQTWIRRLNHYLSETGLGGQDSVLLDYGCGGFDLGLALAPHCRAIDGYEPHLPSCIEASTASRFHSNSAVYNAISDLPHNRYDVIVVNSVIQYMNSQSELDAFFDLCRSLLRTDGKKSILIADIIPQGYSPYLDALESLRVALNHGFFLEMLLHLIKSAINGHGTRLTRHDQKAFDELARGRGFRPHFLPENLTPSRRRYTCLLRLNASEMA